MMRLHFPLRRTAIDAALALIAGTLLLAVLARSSEPTAPLPSGTLVAAGLRGHALTVIDLRSGNTTRIELPGGPHELLRLPDGRAVASLEQAGALAVVDLSTGAVEVIPTDGLPHGLALDGDALAVTDRAARAVRRFEPGSWRELASIPAGDLPHALAAHEHDALLVANAGAPSLALGGMLVAQPALTESIAVSPSGGRIAVAGAEDGRVLVYARDGAPLLDTTVGGRPVRLAYSPDGRTLAAALSASSQVALLSETGDVRFVRVPGVPDGLAFDATGRVLFVSNITGGEVTALDVASGRVLATYRAGTSAGALLLLD
jgi:DNA-binding beta-propeller fold protein YncE